MPVHQKEVLRVRESLELRRFLAISPPTLISINTGIFFPDCCAEAFSFRDRRNESTESTAANSSTALAALLLCRCPIRWNSASRRSRSESILPANSCTRFSPNNLAPAL